MIIIKTNGNEKREKGLFNHSPVTSVSGVSAAGRERFPTVYSQLGLFCGICDESGLLSSLLLAHIMAERRPLPGSPCGS